MHKLFSLSFRRIAQRLGQEELNALNVAQALQNSNIPSCGQGFLYRLPRDELKEILSIPCPINNLEESSSKAIIDASKALRHHGKINEEKICIKCPFKESCPCAKQAFTGTIQNAPKDLLIFWSGLNAYLRPQSIYFRHWVSAYKLGDSIIAALNDLSEGGKQIQQYQRLRVSMLQQHEQIMKKKAQELQKKEGRALTSSQIDEKFKLIQKLTKDQSLKSQEEIKEDQAKAAASSNDFAQDPVQQFQPKPTKVKENVSKQKKYIRSEQNLQNHIGYQSIQKRQDANAQRAYQKPQPKKIQKKHQYQQVVNDVQLQPKNPKIRVKKQPNNSPENKKSTSKSGKGQNKKQQRQQFFQQNEKRFGEKKGNVNKYQNKNSKFTETRDDQTRKNKSQQKGPGKKYQQDYQKQYPKKQKYNQYENREKFQFKPNQRGDSMRDFNKAKTNKTQQFDSYEKVQQKPKPSVRVSPIIQNDVPKQKSEGQESQGRAGRNVRRRPRSTIASSNPQNQ